MPYKDKEKQRKAAADSQRRRYHAPGSTLKEYYRTQTRAVRSRKISPVAASKAAAVAEKLLQKAEVAARIQRLYTGKLTPGGF
jgi:hypothetical protein